MYQVSREEEKGGGGGGGGMRKKRIIAGVEVGVERKYEWEGGSDRDRQINRQKKEMRG